MTTKTPNTKPLTKTQLDYLGARIAAARKARIEKFLPTVPLLKAHTSGTDTLLSATTTRSSNGMGRPTHTR